MAIDNVSSLGNQIASLQTNLKKASTSQARLQQSGVSLNDLSALLAQIQQLIEQLNQQSGNGNSSNDSSKNGTDGGTRKGDAGNNTLQGTSGDDLLLGRKGNDRLIAGEGDDILKGGRGRDTLVSVSGNDQLSGGKGSDLARIKGGNLSDYSVSVGEDHLLLTHVNGKHSVTLNNDIERVRFNDTTVSFSELRKIVDPGTPPKPVPPQHSVLDIDPLTRQAIQNHYGIAGEQNFTMIDRDGNKTLSAGDVVSVTGGATGEAIRDIVLTDGDLHIINGTAGTDQSGLLPELNANRQLWENNRPDSYAYTLERSGFLGPEARIPVELNVSGNQVTASELTDGSGSPVPDFNELTVDDLFDTIQRAIDSNAAEIRVSYDPEYGYPTSIYIDQSSLIADEEVSLKAGDLQEADGAATSSEPVSGGGITVGGKDKNIPLPDDKIVTIRGQQYSIGFLKSQVDDYVASSYLPTIIDKALKLNDWGSGSIRASAAFEQFIADTYPNGEPVDNSTLQVEHQGQHLIVNGQTYTPGPLPADISDRSLIITPGDQSDRNEIKQILEEFPELAITNEFAQGGFAVQVPQGFLSQYKQALEDWLPGQTRVGYDGLVFIPTPPAPQ